MLPIDTIDGRKCYHFTMTSRTYEFVDVFYNVRDRIDFLCVGACPVEFVPREIPKGYFTGDTAGGTIQLDRALRETLFSL